MTADNHGKLPLNAYVVVPNPPIDTDQLMFTAQDSSASEKQPNYSSQGKSFTAE